MTPSTNKKKSKKPSFAARLHSRTMDEHAVGLDVHNGRIAATHFVRQRSGLVLNALATETYDPTLSEKELAHTVRSFWKKNKLPTRTVATCLHSPSLIVRPFSYTNVEPKELPHVLSLEIEETLQLPPEDISLSWHLHPENKPTGKTTGAVVAAPRQIIKDHIKQIKAAGLFPVHIDVGCSAVTTLYDFINENTETSPVCLVSLSSQMGGLVIVSNGTTWPRLIFSNHPAGWQNDLPFLIENIESALLQYQLRTNGEPVAKLLLAAHPQQQSFSERIAESIDLPVENWDPYADNQIPLSRHLKRTHSLGKEKTMNLSVPLGLGLRHPKRAL